METRLDVISQEPQRPSRVEWLDDVRGVACLMVVLLHVSAEYLYQFQSISTFDWLVGNAVDSLVRASVPLFFMISGYLFFRERPPTAKHFVRLLLALAVYSFIALLYRAAFLGERGQIMHLLLRAPVSPVFYHLWYFYALIGVYFVAVLAQLRPGNSGWSLIALAVLLFAFNSTVGTLRIAATGADASEFSFPGFFRGPHIYYIFYGLAGATIGSLEEARGRLIPSWALWFFLVACSTAIAYFTYLATTEKGAFVARYYEYNNILVTGAAISIFMMFRFRHPRNSSASGLFRLVAEHSLAIYGVHALILHWIGTQGLRGNSPLIDIPLTWLVVVIISLALARVLRLVDRRRLFT